MSKPTQRLAADKPRRPKKPRPDFPLFPHATGRWAKKVRGKLHYFGKVATDSEGKSALDLWLDQKDDLLAGRTPRVGREGLTVRELVDRFMVSKRHLLDNQELSPRTFVELFGTCERIGKTFGLTRLVDDLAAEDFENLRRHIAKRWGPVRLGNEVQRVRSVFKYGFEAGLMDRPARFGPGFKKPSRKVLRLARASKGSKMFDAGQLRTILDAADLTMRAMVFLGVNCGFGPADVANLPLTAVDLKAGWVEFPRPKTGVPRRCPLWNETIEAVRTALDRRPDARDAADAGLVFITKYGKRWAKADVETDPETGKVTMSLNQPVTEQFSKLLRKLKLNRPGLGFYALRHTFETIGGDSRDQVAVDALMGHIRDDMASLYREKIEDARLESVTRHVHGWLFPVVRKRKAK